MDIQAHPFDKFPALGSQSLNWLRRQQGCAPLFKGAFPPIFARFHIII
jgi:hypothetical protein